MRNKRYDYKPSFEDTVAIAENRGSGFDPLFKDVKMFKPRQGSNLVRILPPTWEGARHYGLSIKYHRNIGPKDRRYLCLDENPSSPSKGCSICRQLYKLGSRATAEDKEHLRVYDGVVYYIVDRDNEKEGLQLWSVTLKMNSQIAAQTVDVRRGSMVDIVNPDKGYDLEFTRRGERLKTDYLGYRIMRESSPLSDSEKRQDAWLEEAYDKPLPSVLNFFSAGYLQEVLFGKSESVEEEEDRPLRRRAVEEDDEGLRPARRERRPARDDNDADERDAREEGLQRRARRAPPDDTIEEEDRSRRRRSVEEEDGREEDTDLSPIRSRERTRTEKELEDDIPFDMKPNGRDEEDEETVSRPRRRLAADEEDVPPQGRRRRAVEDDDAPPVSTDTRQRLRERLDRSE